MGGKEQEKKREEKEKEKIILFYQLCRASIDCLTPEKFMQFNKNIYKLKAVESTIKAFRKIASFRFSENKHYYIVKIEKSLPETKDVLKDEFCNYVLSAMNE